MVRAHVIGIGMVVLLAGPAVVAAGEKYRDGTCGYTLELPRKWQQAPPGAVGALNAAATKYTKQQIDYVAGFIPVGQTSNDFPRVLVQYTAWPTPPSTYEQLESALKKELPSALKKMESSVPISLQSLGENAFYLDREKNRMVIRLRAAVPGVGTVDCVSFGMLGKKGAIFLHCYARQNKFNATLPTFEQMANSFKFDAGKEFVHDANASSSSWGGGGSVDWSGGMSGGLRGGLIGGAIGAVVAAATWLRRRTAA